MSDENTEHRQTLQAEGWVTQAGRFEVLAITAGNGNGWEFGEDVLRASLSLWDSANCFVDHAWFGGHSVRDLAGVFNNPQWDPVYRGILVELTTTGPSGPLVDRLGRELLQEGEPKPNVGFSADVYFTSKGRQVVQITRVASLDLVINPARGGAFVRALNSAGADLPEVNPTNQKGEEIRMAETQETTEAPANADLEGLRALLAVQQEQQRLAQEAQAVRLQACQYLLDSGLAASKLPAPMQEHVRKQMQGRIFAASELQQAIDDARELVSSLSGSVAVAGPAIHSIFSSEDQLQAAVDDLFGVPRDDALRTAHVARLSGIRELYLMLTGDNELHGGYYPSRARLATTADFTGLVKNALNKIVANQWSELGRAGYDWWQRVTVQEQFASVNDITGTLMGTVGTLPSVAEGAEYTELAIGDSPETASFTKYGGYIPLTLELIDRDETRKLRAYPRELANAGLRRLSGLVATIFTANSGVGPTMADGGALFNNTAVTTAGGHANLLTTALSAGEWEVVSAAVYNQPMLIKNAAGLYGNGPKQAINPKYLLVPRALELTAKNLLYNPWYAADNRHQANLQQGEPGDVVTVPEWTDSTDWAAACDPRIAPAIYIGTRFGIMPEVFIAGNELSPAVFMNDEHRLKVRHFLAVWVNDFRPLHKSNVAG
jgi:hypothetical protein